MKIRSRIAVVAAAIMVLALAPSASAATSPVEINIHIVFNDSEQFTADGICPSGEAFSYGFHIVGRGRAQTFHLFKDLVCDDGSGVLTIRVDAAFVAGTPGTVGGWNVVGGAGDWAGVHGGGHIVATAFDGGIDDHYTGRLTN
jgi:hypothetical protein